MRFVAHREAIPRAQAGESLRARLLQFSRLVERTRCEAFRSDGGCQPMSDKQVSAVVLAGSHHWSGSSFERLAPRPLVPVALAPLITYSLRWLRDAGVRRVTICANGATRAIEDALGDGGAFGMDLSYYQDGMPRGAAGCVRDAGARTASETFVITDGTAIPTADLAELLASHDASGAAATAVVHREPSRAASPTPGGVYVFERRVLGHVGENGFQDIKENLIPKLHRAGERVVAHESDGFCPHVLDARTYLAVNQWMLQRLAYADPSAGGIFVDPSATVEPGARLVGPVQLGAGVRVEAGATIVGPASIGAESTVARDALVACSAVWSRCAVGAGSVVHGCVLGSDAVIAPSTRLFNVVRSQRQAQPGPLRAAFWGHARTAAPLRAHSRPALPTTSCAIG
jgi:NDP-sugar pyrophosphorylase family protein